MIEDWREDYNGIRGHESLGNRPLRPICQGLLKAKTLFMTCLLDGEVYATASRHCLFDLINTKP